MKTKFEITGKAFKWLLLLPVLLLALSGCGGGSSGSPLAISGKVIDGPVSGAQIIVYQVASSGLTQEGTGYTQEDGSFALTINNYNSSDYYLLYVSGGTFSDKGSSTASPTMVGFLVPGGTPTVYITPLTTLIGEALFNADGTINTSLNSTQVDFYLKQMLYYIGQLFNGLQGQDLNSMSLSNPANSQLINEILALLQDLADTVKNQTGEKYGQAMQDLLNYLSIPNNGAKQALLAALTGNGGNGNFVFDGFQFTGNGGGTENISGILNSTDQTGFENAEMPPALPSGLKNIVPNFSIPANFAVWIASGDGTVRKLDSAGNVSGPYNVGPDPDSIAVDSNGNVWAAGDAVVAELSPAGASEQTCYLHTGSVSSGSRPNYNDSNYLAVDYKNNVWVTSAVGYDYTPVIETTPPRSYPGWGDGEGGYYENGTSQIYDWWDGAIIELNTASCSLDQSANPYIRYFDTYSSSGDSISSPGPIAVDHSGNLWVDALGGGFPTYGQSFSVNVAEFSSSTGNLISLPGGVPDPGLQNFNSIATDPAGNIWAFAGLYAPANPAGTPDLSEIKPGGPVADYTVVSQGSLESDGQVPFNGFPMAVDPSGNIWIAITQYGAASSTAYEYSSSNGTLINQYDLDVTVPGFQVSQAPEQMAFDSSGDAWVIGKGANGADGVIVIDPKTAGGKQAFFQVPDPVAITGGSYTLTAPSVSSVSPAKSATGVSTSSAVTATFSAAMNSSTINSGTFTITGPNGTQITGTVGYDASTNTATFTPSLPLSTGTSYTATITTGAEGADNVALASAYSWSFTTTAPSAGGTNTFTAGTEPMGIAIDASGHIWVANSGDGTVEELNSSGGVIGTFGGGNITGAGYIAIDASGNVWVTGNGTAITELLKSSGYATSATFNMTTAGSGGIAIDASGNVWATNTYSGTMTNLYEFLAPNYTSSNTFSTGFGGGVTTGLAIDASGNVWVGYNSYGYGEVTELLSSNSYSSSNSFPNNITGPEGIAIDAAGNAWATNLAASNPSTSAGTVVKLTAPSTSSSPYTLGAAPEGVAIDSAGNIWVANKGGNTVTELNSSGNTVKTYSVGTNPVDVAIDSAGNVWVTNYGDGTISELVGAATGPQFFPYSGPQFP